MTTTLAGEQLSQTFEKYSTVLGVAGSPRLVSTGEATNILPLGVCLVSPTGTPYSATGGGGGGGGAVTIADPTTSTNQAAVLAPGSSGSFAVAVQGVTGGTAIPVSGTFWQTTQPVSLASLPALASGSNTIGIVNAGTGFPSTTAAGTSGTNLITVQGSASGVAIPVSGTFWQATQPVSGTVTANAGTGFPSTTAAGTSGTNLITVQGSASGVAIPVSGTFWQSTQPVSLASLPSLASGSNTIGAVNAGTGFPSTTSAGTSGSNLITVQGSASGVAIPVSGTVTANAGTGFPSTTSAGTSGSNLITVQGSASGVAIPVSLATLPALVASTANIGNVGGKTSLISVTPTLTASSAYATGNEVGGLMTFSNALLTAGSGVLQTCILQCKSVQTATFKLYIFKSNPSNSTWTNKSAPAINAADIPALVGVYTFSTPDSGLGTHTLYVVDAIGQAINAGATTLYGVLVTTGTPTFTSTSDINVLIGLLQD